jgi:hypothetical protein
LSTLADRHEPSSLEPFETVLRLLFTKPPLTEYLYRFLIKSDAAPKRSP